MAHFLFTILVAMPAYRYLIHWSIEWTGAYGGLRQREMLFYRNIITPKCIKNQLTWLSDVVDALLLVASSTSFELLSSAVRFPLFDRRPLSNFGEIHLPCSSINCNSSERLRNRSWLQSSIASSSHAPSDSNRASVNFLIWKKKRINDCFHVCLER